VCASAPAGFRLLEDEADALVNIRDLLAHRTGLPRHDAALFTLGEQASQTGLPTRDQLVYNARFLQ
jgi:CubicO group peptidase (beta-lactamase class C family)